mmetsp:Transcript_58654/g.136933  ORF Transcript_58654/g.136933 Transcript_58654/m.136933 type:complete len:143 (-) Transcript_58654:172-600(-)
MQQLTFLELLLVFLGSSRCAECLTLAARCRLEGLQLSSRSWASILEASTANARALAKQLAKDQGTFMAAFVLAVLAAVAVGLMMCLVTVKVADLESPPNPEQPLAVGAGSQRSLPAGVTSIRPATRQQSSSRVGKKGDAYCC